MKKNTDSLTLEEKIALALKKSFQLEGENRLSNDTIYQDSDVLDPGVIRGLNSVARSLDLDDIVNEDSLVEDGRVAEPRSSGNSFVNPSVVEGIMEWMLSALENVGGTFANPTVAKASSGDTPLKLNSKGTVKMSDRSWKQDGILFSLHSAGKKNFAVTLKIHGTCDQRPVQLCWIEQASLNAQSSVCENHILKFPVRAVDNHTYDVTIPAAVYSKRMRAIISAENQGDIKEQDVRHFLPFVEFDGR